MRALLIALALVSVARAEPASSPWWRHAVIYEIYPRSFQDSNGDGIGDLDGITQRLDYLRALGVDAIWLTPIYPSPQVDFGYDIADYERIDPQYGTMADFDRLVAEAKRRKIRVLMDLVMNHTSDQHAWFRAAASKKDDPKHGWYVWSDGKLDASGKHVPPNNWTSLFGGSAWEWVPAVQQFYYHRFYKQQPDLDFTNPAVEQAMLGVARFWLERGVAGYRLDAVSSLFEDPQRRNEPAYPGLNELGDPKLAHIYTDNLPPVHDIIRHLRATADKYGGVLIGETYLPSTAALDAWYGGAKQDELQLPMDMQVGIHGNGHETLDVNRFRQRLVEVTTQVHGGQPLIVFDNHDNARSWDRYGDGTHDADIARLVAALLLTARATPILYYGQELGMKTTVPQRKQDVRDPIGITGWPKEKGRDGERTPMQWDGSPNAGFSKSKPWLPVPKDATTINVEAELADPRSLYHWYQTLIALKLDGEMVMLDDKNQAVLSYERKGAREVFVALNMSDKPQPLTLPKPVKTILTDDRSLDAATGPTVTLAPYAAWIAEAR